jgi:hypothetical protein
MRKPGRTSKKQVKKSGPKRRARKVARPTKKMPKASKARRISGTVNRIVRGKHPTEKLSAEQAFSDPEQAAAQVESAA